MAICIVAFEEPPPHVVGEGVDRTYITSHIVVPYVLESTLEVVFEHYEVLGGVQDLRRAPVPFQLRFLCACFGIRTRRSLVVFLKIAV